MNAIHAELNKYKPDPFKNFPILLFTVLDSSLFFLSAPFKERKLEKKLLLWKEICNKKHFTFCTIVSQSFLVYFAFIYRSIITTVLPYL